MNKTKPLHVFFAMFAAMMALCDIGKAEDAGLVSTMELMSAVSSVQGISIVPVSDIPSKSYTEDYSSSQVFEIIRPDMGPITVGRLGSSCTCVRVSMDKRSFAAGERAILEVRNVKATPAAGAKYAIFVQLTSPVKQALQYDLFVKSDRKPGAAAPQAGQPAVRSASPVAQPVRVAPMPTGQAAPIRQGGSAVVPPQFRYEDITPYPKRERENANP